MSSLRYFFFVIFFIFIYCCGTPNDKSLINPITGKHSSDWYTAHKAVAKKTVENCRECHGNDLLGGISKVSCYSNSFRGMVCHQNGPVSHPTGWSNPDNHGSATKKANNTDFIEGFIVCQNCHGIDYKGGLAISCLSQNCHTNAPHPNKPWRGSLRTHTNTDESNAVVCGQCHRNSQIDLNTPSGCFNNTLCHGGNVSAPHLIPFKDKALHGVEARANIKYCATCHATISEPTPGSNPRFNVKIGTLNNGCEDCHPINSAHPNNSWLIKNGNTTSHMDASNLTDSCVICHGSNLSGGIAPSCTSNNCHITSPVLNKNCTSCHSSPPTGNITPNRDGKHTIHNSLTGVNCESCHFGKAIKMTSHSNGIPDLTFSNTYNAKNAIASYNITTQICTNVSCHGGKQTPNWYSGTIDVNTECSSCHVSRSVSDQYNSFFSGQHNKHISKGISCNQCHDTTKLAVVHFNDINSTQMSEAFKTIIDNANYTGTGILYGNCTIKCHNEDHNNKKW